jgi:type IV pilus assembly protein PilA
MYQRFLAMREQREGGFTLIELLVVILIIAILAAIAIPVFLNQRQRAYVAQAESALKNGATAMESLATQNNGAYQVSGADPTVAQLKAEGYRDVSGVTLDIDGATTDVDEFCLTADHAALGAAGSVDYRYDSHDGRPTTDACVSGS